MIYVISRIRTKYLDKMIHISMMLPGLNIEKYIFKNPNIIIKKYIKYSLIFPGFLYYQGNTEISADCLVRSKYCICKLKNNTFGSEITHMGRSFSGFFFDDGKKAVHSPHPVPVLSLYSFCRRTSWCRSRQPSQTHTDPSGKTINWTLKTPRVLWESCLIRTWLVPCRPAPAAWDSSQ